jgi:uncharacterized protein (UPF0333 family)
MGKFWNKYKNLVIFVIITFIIMFIAFYIGLSKISGVKSWFWGFILALDTSTAIALAVLAFSAYMEYAKGEDEIKLKFEVLDEKGNILFIKDIKSDNKDITILRKNLSRAEILGVMGMIQKTSTEKFEIDNKTQIKLLKRINEIQKGNKKEFLIPVLKENYDEYFNLEFQKSSSDF